MTTSKVYARVDVEVGRRSTYPFGRRGGGTRPSLVNPWSRALEKGRGRGKKRRKKSRAKRSFGERDDAISDRQTRRLAFSLDYLSTTRSIDYE